MSRYPAASNYDLDRELDRAAELLATADSLLITAGAGMGVDSGLPDYRGNAGIWTNHAAFKLAGLTYEEVSSARAYFQTPDLAWGVYGHFLQMYRDATPHPGFDVLLEWTHLLPRPSFVFTSNVDGQFQKAGFPEKRMQECHGSMHILQCTHGCTPATWSARNVTPQVDPLTLRWQGDIPRCIHCGKLSRPNILMFQDANWVTLRDEQQAERFKRWREEVERPVVIEIGAGLEIPRVRNVANAFRHGLIRINPVHHDVRGTDVALRTGAAHALQRLAGLLSSSPS